MAKPVAILASARSNGNTARVLQALCGDNQVDVVDLRNLEIEHYDYEIEKSDDDFITVARRLTESRLIFLATPVYWYSMSGRLKVFFDRLTDLTSVHKELGRALAGRTVVLVSSSTEEALPPGFEQPFQASCDYLKMVYGGSFHGWCRNGNPPPQEVLEAARAFGQSVLQPFI